MRQLPEAVTYTMKGALSEIIPIPLTRKQEPTEDGEYEIVEPLMLEEGRTDSTAHPQEEEPPLVPPQAGGDEE